MGGRGLGPEAEVLLAGPASSTLAMEESPFREPVLDAKSEVSTGWEEKGLGRTLAPGWLFSKSCLCFRSRSPAR